MKTRRTKTIKTKYYLTALIALLLLQAIPAQSQELIVNVLIPPGSLVQKEQLWNLLVSNPSQDTRLCQVSLTVTSKNSGRQLLTAVSNIQSLPPGVRRLQASDLLPVIYNPLSTEVNLSGYGLLPVGHYQLCYEFINKGMVIGSACVDTEVDALSPPQLIYPTDKSQLKETQPGFSWLPPISQTAIPNCRYSYKLVKIDDNQTATEAARDNLPVYEQAGLTTTMLPYPASAPAIQKGQPYAWQVSAYSGESRLQSEVWEFQLQDSTVQQPPAKENNTYSRLQKTVTTSSYSIVKQLLKFQYINETTDSIPSISFTDVTEGRHKDITLPDKTDIPNLTAGLNLVTIDLSATKRFTSGHVYEMTLTDSKGNKWKMMFEYKN